MNELEKEFIPYTEALELKELGFDEPCFAITNGSKLFYGEFKSTHEYYKANGQILYQQAFRWLLEKHNLTWEHQFDDSNISLYVGEITYPDNNLDFFKVIEVEYNGYTKAYEEAELACLKKLIEIVKKK
jgi:hypothetical protein